MTFLGIFQHEVKDIIFTWRRAFEVSLNPCEVRLKWTSEMEDGGDLNEHQKTQKLRTWMEGVIDLQKSGNKFRFRFAQVW